MKNQETQYQRLLREAQEELRAIERHVSAEYARLTYNDVLTANNHAKAIKRRISVYRGKVERGE